MGLAILQIIEFWTGTAENLFASQTCPCPLFISPRVLWPMTFQNHENLLDISPLLPWGKPFSSKILHTFSLHIHFNHLASLLLEQRPFAILHWGFNKFNSYWVLLECHRKPRQRINKSTITYQSHKMLWRKLNKEVQCAVIHSNLSHLKFSSYA